MMLRVAVFVVLPLAALAQWGWGARPETGSGNEHEDDNAKPTPYFSPTIPPPRPGECQYTFTVTGFHDSCRTAEIEQLVRNLRRDYDAVKAENAQLKKDIASIRADYEGMVEAVKTLEAETLTWREIIEWPNVPLNMEPDNASLIILSEPSYPDCAAAKSSGHGKQGIYSLEPDGATLPFFGYCDEDSWTVIQRRFDGSVDFYRNWDDYAYGFGELSGEFWLGLDNIHLITMQKDYELRAEMLGWNNRFYTQNYPNFRVLGDEDQYELQIGNMTSGNYKDVLSERNGLGFTAIGHDNDEWSSGNCAEYYRGAWWLTSCGYDINREWCSGPGCMTWGDKIIKKSVLKIRPMSGSSYHSSPTGKTERVRPTKPKKPKKKKNRGEV